MDITQIMQAALTSIGGGNNPQAVVKQTSDVLKTMVAEETVATNKVMQANAEVANRALRGQLEAQQSARRIATELGTNEADASSIMGFLSKRMRESAIRASDAAAKAADLEANNDLFTNPLGFVRDLVFGDEIRGNAQATLGEFETNARLLSNLNAATQQSTATQNAIAETMTEATLAATQTAQAEAMKVAAAQSVSKIAQIDMDMALRVSQLNAQQAAQANAAAHLKIAQANAELNRLQKELIVEDRQRKAEAEVDMVNMWNTAAETFNAPKAKSYKDIDVFRNLNKERADFILMRGAELLNPAAGGVRYGSNPLEALEAIQSFGVQLAPTQEQVAKKLTISFAGITPDDLVNVGMARNSVEASQLLNDPKQGRVARAQALSKIADSQRLNVKPGDATNIYAPPKLDTFKDAPYMEQNKFLANYVKPRAAAGNAEFDPASVLKQAADAVSKGEVSTSEAADGITWIANQIIATNNSLNNYRSFGLPHMTSLPMPVSIGGGITQLGYSNSSINLADPVSVTRTIAEVLAKQKQSESIIKNSTPFFLR